MGIRFDSKAASELEAWYQSETGQAIFHLQMDTIFRLLKPRKGERLLDVGCGVGAHLQRFKREGLSATGVDPSPEALDLAGARLGSRAGLFPGRAEDLPFEDNDFDLVTMINTLELVENPREALAEAVRVARRRVLVGVLNCFSLTGAGWRIKGLLGSERARRFRQYSWWSLTDMLKNATGSRRIHSATVGILPVPLARQVRGFEALPWVQKNPWGSFLVATVDLAYTVRTDNLTVTESLKKLTTSKAPRPSPTGVGSVHHKFGRERPRRSPAGEVRL